MVEENIDVVLDKIGDRKLKSLKEQFGAWKLVKFTARVAKRKLRNYKTVQLVRYLGSADDIELLAFKKKLKRAIEFQDRLFGTITHNRDAEWFEGAVRVEEESIGLLFETDSMDTAKAMVRMAKPLWRSRRKWFKEFFAIVESQVLGEQGYLDQLNDSRASFKQEPLSSDEFLELLGNPCNIYFRLDEENELNFEIHGASMELFGDHGVSAFGNYKDGLYEAMLD